MMQGQRVPKQSVPTCFGSPVTIGQASSGDNKGKTKYNIGEYRCG